MSFYITTPIYYVNAQPHLGHAYTTIAADVLARHMRQRGEDVFFLTGTDEHGEPVADAARAQGLEPKELADRNAERFKALAPQLDASNDFFIRTSDEQHKAKVQEVLQRVHDNGYTYKGLYEGWYCPRCADFKVENEILEGNRCPIHEIPLDARAGGELVLPPLDVPGAARAPVRRAPRLRDAPAPLQRGALVHRPGAPGHLALAQRLKWGVTVPWDPEHVFYVWFDALLNYYTALSYARPGEDLTDRFWPATLPHHRQGHPQVPHGVLAGDADGGRAAGAPARVRPRLPARLRRAQDEQVARQRARPVRGDRRSTAPTRCAST